MDKQDIIQMAREAGSMIELAQEKDLRWLERFAQLVAAAKAKEIADKCEKLPFGDTAHSFAVWIREQSNV